MISSFRGKLRLVSARHPSKTGAQGKGLESSGLGRIALGTVHINVLIEAMGAKKYIHGEQ